MLRLRIGLVALLVVFVVRIFLTSGVKNAIMGVNADSKTLVKETTALLQQNPRNYEAYTKRGDAEYALFKPKNAIQDYTNAIGIMPSAKLYNKRADAYTLDGKSDLADQDRNSAKNFH